MTWAEVRERNAALQEVLLAAARTDLTAPLRLTPDARRLFGSVDGVLLALQQRWSTQLAARLDQATEAHDGPEVAWRQLAADEPVLRAVLDAGLIRSAALRAARGIENWMLEDYRLAQRLHAARAAALTW